MNPKIKIALLFAGAFAFLIFGIIGLALPFLQGFFFIAIGLILLSIASPKARAWIEQRTCKFPKIHLFVREIESKIAYWIGEDPPTSAR